MKHSSFLNEKYGLSRLGLGSAQFGMDYGFSQEKSQDEVNAILSKAIDLGINFIDTARDYGNSEKKIGAFLKENSDKNLIVATKLAYLEKDIWLDAQQLKDAIYQSVNTSLSELSLNVLPILQLHQLEAEILNQECFWGIIQSLKQESLIDAFGISVYDPDQTATWIAQYGDVIDLIQIPFNVFDQRFCSLFDSLKSNNVEVISRSIYLKGMLTASVEEIPDELKDITAYKQKLGRIAAKNNMDVKQLAASFVLAQEQILSTIVGVNSLDELEENVELFHAANEVQDVLASLKECAIHDNELLIDPRKWTQL